MSQVTPEQPQVAAAASESPQPNEADPGQPQLSEAAAKAIVEVQEQVTGGDYEGAMARVEHALQTGAEEAGPLLGQVAQVLAPGPNQERALAALFAHRTVPEQVVRFLVLTGQAETGFALADVLAGKFPDDPEVLTLAAFAAVVAGKTDRALELWGRLIQLDPGNAQWYVNRGRVHQQSEAFGEAESDYTKAVELDPSLGEAWTARGILREVQQRYQDALAAYEQALKLQPEDPGSWRNRGDVRMALGDAKGAESDYQKAIELNPDYAGAHLGLSSIRFAENDYQGALDQAQRAVDLTPDDPAARFNRGRAQAMLGFAGVVAGRSEDGKERLLTARADYDRILEVRPAPIVAFQRGLVLVVLGDLAAEGGDASEAETLYRAAVADQDTMLQADPTNVQALLSRGRAKRQMGDTQGAEADFTAVIGLQPDLAEGYAERARTRLAREDAEGAMPDADRALAIDPANQEVVLLHAQAASAAGLALIGGGKPNKGAELLERAGADYAKAVEAKPSSALWNQLGLLHVVLGEAAGRQGDGKKREAEFVSAVAAYDRAVDLDPANGDVLVNRGRAKQQLDQFDQAEADTSKALELDPKNGEAWTARGILREARGRTQEALDDYEHALKLLPQDPNAWRNRADTRLALGDAKGAEEDYGKAVELNPQFVEAYLGRARARSALNEVELALRDFDLAVDLSPESPTGYLGRADALLASGEYDRAVWDYDRAIELSPDNAAAWRSRGYARLQLAEVYRVQRLYDLNSQCLVHSLDDCDQAVRRAPDDPYSLAYRGYALRGLQAYDEAATAFTAARERKPTLELDLWFAAEIAETYRTWNEMTGQAGLLQKADGLLSKLLSAQPVGPALVWPQVVWAEVFIALERIDDALAASRRAVASDPGSNLAALERGKIEYLSGELPAATSTFREVMAREPREPAERRTARVGLALSLRTSPHEAESALKEALEGKETPDAYLDRGDEFIRFRAREDAEQDYRQAAKLDPDYRDAQNQLAWSLLQGQFDRARVEEAVEVGRRAVAGMTEGPTLGLYLDTLGWACHLAGRSEEAAGHLRKAVWLVPRALTVRFHWEQVEAATLATPAH